MLTRSRPLHLALVTQRDLMDWEVDDEPLKEGLVRLGARVSAPVWDDPDVDWSRFDGALIRTTWDYSHQVERFVAWAREVSRHTLLLHGPEVVAWNTDKTYLRQLGEAGVPLAPTVWLEQGGAVDVAAVMAERGWTRGFLKPLWGAAARETLRFDADADGLAEAQTHCNRLLPTESLMLQPYLPRVETEGELSVVVIDGQVTHGVRKIPVPGDYRVQDDFGASDEAVVPTDELLDLAALTLDAAGRRMGRDAPLLYARVDVLHGPEGRLVLNELELVEPSLFFRHGRHAAGRLARAVVDRVRRARHLDLARRPRAGLVS